MYAIVNSGSAATFKPTCFMEATVLAPAIDAPAADSTATFSFGAHSAFISSLYKAIFSSISVLGVPGYAEANLTPAS